MEVFQAIVLKGRGEISSIFGENNGKPRGPPKQITSLECSFSRGSRHEIFLPIVDDSIKFFCDKAIYLNGFIVCNRIDDEIAVSVVTQRPQISTNTLTRSENETQITFDTPIRLANCESCTITIESAILQDSRNGLYGFQLQQTIPKNGYSFRFDPKACQKFNLITRLLYNIIDE